MEHIKDAFECGASAVLAASIFHFKRDRYYGFKRYLKANNIPSEDINDYLCWKK